MKKLLLIISLALIVTQSTQCVQAIAARLGWKLFNAFCLAGSAAQCAIEGFNSLDALQKADNIPLSEAEIFPPVSPSVQKFIEQESSKKGIIEYLQNSHEWDYQKCKKILQDDYNDPKTTPYEKCKIKLHLITLGLDFSIWESHPSTKSRIAKFRERIDTLNKETKQQFF